MRRNIEIGEKSDVESLFVFYNHKVYERAKFYGLSSDVVPEVFQVYEVGKVTSTLLPYFQLPLFF